MAYGIPYSSGEEPLAWCEDCGWCHKWQTREYEGVIFRLCDDCARVRDLLW